MDLQHRRRPQRVPFSARQARNATIGGLIGLYGSTWPIAWIALGTGRPVTGAACITIAAALGLFGGLAGAAVSEEI